MAMKYFRLIPFALMALAAFIFTIIALCSMHWVTIDNPTNLGTSTGNNALVLTKYHAGLRRWYTEINGKNQDSHTFVSDICDINTYAQCRFHRSGSWGLGWGIPALLLQVGAILVIACMPFSHYYHGWRGKRDATTMLWLSAIFILIGAITYHTHLPGINNTGGYNSHLSWSFVLFVIGGAIALVTAIGLCMMPTKHYYYGDNGPASSRPVIATTTTTTTTAVPMAAVPMAAVPVANVPMTTVPVAVMV